jgi:hypothetical protein
MIARNLVVSQYCDTVNCVEFGRFAVREALDDLFQGGNITVCHDQVAHSAWLNSFRIDASQFAKPARKSSIAVLPPPLCCIRQPVDLWSTGFLVVGH